MLLKKKQVHTPPSGDSQLKPEAANLMRAQVKRKGLATLGALLLLVSVTILGTIAWYTRVSNVTGMSMDVAKFDFNANYASADDTFIIDVGGFLDSTLTKGKAAPGTSGVIPIRMSSGASDTAVSYSLNLDFSETADEFQKRLRFYYYTLSGSDYVLHIIDPATATATGSTIIGNLAATGESGDTKYEYIYWEWVYELDDDWFLQDGKWYQGTETYEIDGEEEPMTGEAYFAKLYPEVYETGEDTTGSQIGGTTTGGTTGGGTTEGETTEGGTTEGETTEGGTTEGGTTEGGTTEPTKNPREAAKEAFDEFDTQIGLGRANESIVCHYAGKEETKTADSDANGTNGHLYAYQKAMMIKVHVTGAQAQPVKNDGTSPITGGTAGMAVYKSTN